MVAITVLVLVEKSRLHALAGRVDDEELRAAARFGVMAIVILPLLPEGPLGPFGGIKPRELWMLVLFFTGLSFAGYLARRMFGRGQGYQLTGLLGGVVSSTNVTFTFARMSRQHKALARPLAVGTIAACTMLFPRVLIAAGVLNLGVARLLLPYLVAPFAIGAVALALRWRNAPEPAAQHHRPDNPLQLVPALQMAALFQLVIFAVTVGGPGVRGPRAVRIGRGARTDRCRCADDFHDHHAHRLRLPQPLPAAIAIGIAANCLLKAGLAAVLGTTAFRRIIIGLLTGMAAAIVVSLLAF